MTSLVLELQQKAASSENPLPDVLRMARMVATKLKLVELNEWIEHELHGYSKSASIPDYRKLRGDVRAHNPYNGYLMPVRYQDPERQSIISECRVSQSIGSLHEVTSGDSEGIQFPFSEHQIAQLRRDFGRDDREWLIPFRKVERSQITAIFDAVRNRILDWTLRLEAEGILGEGMTFTPQEKSKAANMTSINIGTVTNFRGIIGAATDVDLSIDDGPAVEQELKTRGFSDAERLEIQQLFAEFNGAPKEGKVAVAKRGIQWVVSNAEKLGSLTTMFRGFFGG